MTAALPTCAGNAAALILCYIKGGADAPPLPPTCSLKELFNFKFVPPPAYILQAHNQSPTQGRLPSANSPKQSKA